ncbi:hypothetical protein FOPG_18983 [Fusarium oxysporum f. sp. conglutinans race 2 54008]|uniref:Uncharacterized protein n=1 Tax=Fusarium oxysporum f. sp. conglutinans race 2 54008 TaxID=1089457 RepID=X0GKK6_FUSOX|nr:hypothetical protein FOPG_19553 [Fusarium oxysporum f. sp. conglutinans race 2 54008]EXL64762.1 hypothetical protein FOPG_18983 [Fusarium oxysporum f. sp. conglutinans race 2 54008]
MSQSTTWDGVNKKHRHYVLSFLAYPVALYHGLEGPCWATSRAVTLLTQMNLILAKVAAAMRNDIRDRLTFTSRNFMAVLTACGCPTGPKRVEIIRIKGDGCSTFYNALLRTP